MKHSLFEPKTVSPQVPAKMIAARVAHTGAITAWTFVVIAMCTRWADATPNITPDPDPMLARDCRLRNGPISARSPAGSPTAEGMSRSHAFNFPNPVLAAHVNILFWAGIGVWTGLTPTGRPL